MNSRSLLLVVPLAVVLFGGVWLFVQSGASIERAEAPSNRASEVERVASANELATAPDATSARATPDASETTLVADGGADAALPESQALEPALAEVQIQFVLSGTDAPVQGVVVRVAAHDVVPEQHVVTEADGIALVCGAEWTPLAFRVELPAGFALPRPGHGPHFNRPASAPLDEFSVQLEAGPTATRMRIPLEFGGSVEGRVTWRGTAVAGRSVVALTCPERVAVSTTMTDVDGTFRLTGLASGDHAVIVDGPHEPANESFVPNELRALRPAIVTIAPQRVEHVHIELGGGTTEVLGRVCDAFGSGAEGVVLRLTTFIPKTDYDATHVSEALTRSWRCMPMHSAFEPHLVDACNPASTHVDVRQHVGVDGVFHFVELPAGIYRFELVGPDKLLGMADQWERPEYDIGGFMNVVDTRQLPMWDAGVLVLPRRYEFEVVVHVLDASGAVIGRDHPLSKAWLTFKDGKGGLHHGAHVYEQPVRDTIVTNVSDRDDLANQEFVVRLLLDDRELVSTTFEAHAIKVVDGRRVLELTLRVP